MVDRVNLAKVERLAASLRERTGELDLGPREARLFVRILRHLSQGHPVTSKDIARIASDEDLSQDEAEEILIWLAERNAAGDIVALGGLSLNDRSSHQFNVDGRELTTWCAFDTLYLPPLLVHTAHVKSPDPVTGEWIRLTVGTEGVEDFTPADAVISLVIPPIKKKGIRSAEEVWTAFCLYSHFFESEANAADWFQGKEQEAVYLSPGDGYLLAQLWFEKLGRHAQASG